ncbi:MAG: hypothetical protein R2755_16265 [Acidimicrobiales bacterium]
MERPPYGGRHGNAPRPAVHHRLLLDELTSRVATLADEQQRAKHEQIAVELDEAERSSGPGCAGWNG